MADRNVANEILTTITSVLSLFGTFFIIISFFMWKDIRTTSRRILVYISVADFFTSVATIAAATNFWLSGSENPQVCLVQSVIGTLSVLCSFFWTVSMAVYLYICVCMKKSRLAERLLYAFHVCSWGIPVLIVTLAASLNKLGDNGNKVSAGWCWVDINLNWSDQVLWMLLAGKLWEVIAYVVIAVLYALLKRNMKKEVNCTRSCLAHMISCHSCKALTTLPNPQGLLSHMGYCSNRALFLKPHLNMRRAGRIQDSYVNP